MLNVALGNRVSVIGMQQLPIEKVLKMKIDLKLRLLCSTKIDLRIEGMPQNEILQDEEQMRDISDAIQKFQRKDYVHTLVAIDKDLDQGNVDTGGNHVKRRKPFNAKSA